MLNLTKSKKIYLQYSFLLLLIFITVYLVSTTLDITLIPTIIKLVDKKFIPYWTFINDNLYTT